MMLWLTFYWLIFQVVSLSCTQFCTEPCCDHVEVYDGSDSDSAMLIESFSGCDVAINDLRSNGRDMFILWASDGSVTDTGFSCNVQYIGNVYLQTLLNQYWHVCTMTNVLQGHDEPDSVYTSAYINTRLHK